MRMGGSRASRLSLLTAMLGLVLGAGALWLGLAEGAIALWGFGAASLLQVPPALSLRGRIREGLGNSGLERDRLTLKVVSHLLRLLALGLAMASVSALLGDRAPQARLTGLGLGLLALGFEVPLWLAKRGLAGLHPALDLDGARARTMLELATLLLAGGLLGFWLPWADAVTGLALALRLFLEGRNLAKGSTLQAAACGGCGSGCGCG
jgi:hypothetical protein